MAAVPEPYPECTFRLRVVAPPGPCSVALFDLSARRRVAAWRGAIARRLLVSSALPPPYRSCGWHACDKAFVTRLMLAAAAADLATRDGSGRVVDFSSHRVRANQGRRSLLHDRILRLLFAHPGHHFSEQHIVCLLKLECPGLTACRIAAHLDDIVGWRLAQRIVADPDNVFYDINTKPHLHVYDARRRTLTDAPASGCLRINSRLANSPSRQH